MSTHPITPDTKIPFPCWLLSLIISGEPKQWRYHLTSPGAVALSFASHYSTNPPDQRPEALLESNPKDYMKAAKWDLPPLVMVGSGAQPDAHRIAEECAKELWNHVYPCGIYTEEQRIGDLAAIIARHIEPLVRELAELQGKEEGYRKAISNYDDWIKRRTETVDQLRAENERLTKLLKAATEPLPDGSPEADGPEKELDGLRADVRRLKQDNNNLQAINSDLVAGNERLRQERDKYIRLYEEEETMRRNANRNNAALRARVAVAEEVAAALQALYDMPDGMPVTDAEFAVWEQSRAVLAKWKEA